MRRILTTLIGCGIILTFAWWVASLPGRVSVDLGTYKFDTSVPIAFVGLIALFGVFYIAFRLLFALFRIGRFHRAWRFGRRRAAGEQAVTRALVALAAGEKADARREATRARAFLGDTPQTLLLAAEAGRLSGREDEAKAALTALAGRKDSAFLGLRGLMANAVAREEWAEASRIARQAEAAHPGAAWLRGERAQLAIRAEQWGEALSLATSDSARAALAVGAALTAPTPDMADRLTRQALKSDPAFVPGILARASGLRMRGQEKKALAVLTEGWKRAPHPDIAALALAPLTDKKIRMVAAQKLVASAAGHAESRLLLARCALDAGAAAEALRYLTPLKEKGFNQRRMWLLLAEIEEEARGETEEGRLAQRDALRRAASADADPEWRCGTCHTGKLAWRPACPVCATPGSLVWGSGPETVTTTGTAIVTRAA